MLRTADLDYSFPPELVATEAKPRGESRILFISRDHDRPEEITWGRFLALFKPGDTLVLNDSQVLWARLLIKKPSGAMGELFFLKHDPKNLMIWEILSKNLNLKEGKVLELPGGVKVKCLKAGRISTIEVQEPIFTPESLKTYFDEFGDVPLPPYIEVARKLVNQSMDSEKGKDRSRYQNVWAKKWGSVAAPTAGLHFSDEHLKMLKVGGVNIETVTLHVGAGTFLPIETENLDDFKIHEEFIHVPQATCDKILKTQAIGKRVWACGTTATRALETAVLASPSANSRLPLIAPFYGETSLFVKPGFRFKVVEGLLTNFHQPGSSLIALASAFATRNVPSTSIQEKACVDKLLKIYQFAVDKRFRLFSYGDLTVMC